MGYDMTTPVEAIYTATLHYGPYHVLVALTHRGNRRTDTVSLGHKTPRGELRLNTRNHHKSLRLAAQPEITNPVFLDTPNLGRVQVQTVHVTIHTYQSVTAFFEHKESISSCTYIYITITTLQYTAHHHIITTKSRDVDIGLNHLAIVITTDAVQTDNQDVTIGLHDPNHDALFAKKLVYTRLILDRHLFAIAAFPEASLAVLHHLVVIPVTGTCGMAVDYLLDGFIFEGVKPHARCAYQKLTVLSLQHGSYAGFGLRREGIAYEPVGSVVITR